MAGIKQVSFTSPYGAEESEIERRRQMAQLLQQQGAQPLGPTETVGGWAVRRSPLEGLNKAVQQGAGAWQESQATEMAKALRERQEGDFRADRTALTDALRGRPADPGVDDPTASGYMPPQAAQAPNPNALQSMDFRSPMFQQLQMQQLMQQMQPQKPVVVGRSLLDPNTGKVVGQDATWQAEQDAARKAKEAELQAKMADARVSRQEREAAQQELVRMQIEGRKEVATAIAGLRQPPQPRILDTAQGPMELGPNGAKPVLGPDGKPLGPKKGAAPLSATAQKELFEADDVANSAQNAIGILQSIIAKDPKTGKSQNDAAYEGGTANVRRIGMSFVPGSYEGESASVDLQNKVTGQALENLKAIFGGMPTEGERKILLDMQGSLNQKAPQREAIFKRAIELAKRRQAINQDKAKRLREGTYFGSGVATNQDGGSVLDQADAILRGTSGNR